MKSIQLIQGTFNSEDAVNIITQMIHIKIRYHENKINNSSHEEDIKYRESKIKSLQKDLFELRKEMSLKSDDVVMSAIINIQ